jgi:hypothetical protein
MAEHEPHVAPFDDQALAEALATRPATIRHEAHGEGLQFSVGDGAAQLQIYPRTGVTRLLAPDLRARVELFDSTIRQVTRDGVEFSASQPGQDASLTVVPDGGIVFTLVAGGKYHRTLETEPDDPSPSPPPPPAPRVRAGETPQEPRSATDVAGPRPVTALTPRRRRERPPRWRRPRTG